ncbi:MAG: AAA family ATPase [Caldilinea sp. CFX5]|nr:AAA family ATPase [Caldilinea sp. CFX5]
MKFPYGDSDFYQIITEGYLYVDRTDRIPLLEEAGKNLTFLRPRRFGKTLLLSMLEYYYDLAKADDFARLFGQLTIGRNPTPLHNQFLIMKWDFSKVNSQGATEEIKSALHDYLNERIAIFVDTYQPYLTTPIRHYPNNALVSFESVVAAVQRTPHRLYLLIDEYDNFANEVMMSNHPTGHERYEALVTGEGLLKTIFKNVKGAMDEGLGRVFITGVSPILLSDITSGHNISESITLRNDLFDLCGFTAAEVQVMVAQIAEQRNLPISKAQELLALMRTFYNGSRFVYGEQPLIYNPTLVFYLLKYFQREGSYPRELLDTNLAPDYQKLVYISQRPNGERLIAAALNEAEPITVVALANRFGLRQLLAETKTTTLLASLLYYLGALTLGGETTGGKLALRVPNLVMRKLYIERLRELALPEVQDRADGVQAAETLYEKGELQPLCAFIEQHYFKVLDNRDYLHANELTVKMAFLSLLYNDTFYIIDSEQPVARGYADLTMILRPEMWRYRLLNILLEFKFIKPGELGLTTEQVKTKSEAELNALDLVKTKMSEAVTQAKRYRAVLSAKYGEPERLHSYAIVAIGFERLLWQPVTE